ncbi:MAG: AEC family transporter [Rhodospirillales bacterium]
MTPILNVVLPVFGIIAAGYLCGRLRVLGQGSSEALNAFVYWVALPALLFHAMARAPVGDIFNGPFLGAYVGAQVLVWGAAMALYPLVFKKAVGDYPLARAGLFGLNGIYGNTGYMGIPLAAIAYGEASFIPTMITVVVNTAFVIGGGVVIIEIAMNRGSGFAAVARFVKAILKSPIIMAPFVGIAWSALGLGLWEPVDTFLGIMGPAAGPCALFAIGLFLVGKPIAEGFGEVAWMTVLKLVINPLVAWALIVTLFPMDPLWAATCILMSALPIGAGSFVLASQYGVYTARTSSATLLTTVLAIVSLSIFFVIFPPTT